MEKKILIIVDVQKDFVDGSLGTPEAQRMIPHLLKKLESFEGDVIFTQDTHPENYLELQEGKNLPVPHCISHTEGWELIPELKAYAEEHECRIYQKPTFGGSEMAEDLTKQFLYDEEETIESIELVGLCTDICVISNALLLKANMPEMPIKVDASCCAGVTPEKHQAALEVMRSCQIMVSGSDVHTNKFPGNGVAQDNIDEDSVASILMEVRDMVLEVCEKSKLRRGQILAVGCSTSEVLGHRMGTWSNPEVGKAIFDMIQGILSERGIYLAAQCCEHLNRAIVISADAVPGAETVNVVPQPKAGGSFGTAAYQGIEHAVVVESIRADAGLDIGGTLIGMHLKPVAVPLKLEHNQIGDAIVLAARTRAKFIGGGRAMYDEELI